MGPRGPGAPRWEWMGMLVAQVGVPRPQEEQGPLPGQAVPDVGSGTRWPEGVGQDEGTFVSCHLYNKLPCTCLKTAQVYHVTVLDSSGQRRVSLG